MRALPVCLVLMGLGLLPGMAGCSGTALQNVSSPPSLPPSPVAATTVAPAQTRTVPAQQPRPVVPAGYCCLEVRVSFHDGGQVALETDGGRTRIVYPRNDVGSDFDVFPAGTRVTLTAEPASNYKFRLWGGDAEGLEARSVMLTIDRDLSVTAFFDCEDG